MPRSLRTMIRLLFGGAVVMVVNAQQPTTRPAFDEGPCSPCHTCENPTPEDLCLRACIRAAARELAEERAPNVVILNELEDLYLPVPFDHKGHADMAEMTQGCVVCHHYVPDGTEHPECKSCHEIAPLREDMRKPSLKAAYHRQCLSCHREWSHETACEVCHPPKAGRGERDRLTTRPTKDDILGAMHPPIPEPDVEIYQTKHEYPPGTQVIFRHKEHTRRFGLRCVECHREDNCLRCHEEGREHTQRIKTLEEHHDPCAHCHDMESPERCGHCHWEEGKPQPPPFDHATIGWPLGRYHEDKSCRVCHKTVRFVKLDRDCNKCHEAWAPDNFNHGITGQGLDENHAETDCEECHIDRKFDQPPTCDECHDEDEGIAFPDKRPGPVVNVKKKTVGGSTPSDKTPPKAPAAIGQEKSGAAPRK